VLCFDKDLLGPFIAQKLNMVWTPENSSTIGWVTDQIESVVWYEDFNGLRNKHDYLMFFLLEICCFL